ncbi:membrane protein [Jannaschia sp. AI_61]|nr:MULTISPECIES: RDD family protein [unclassified Jannaschia]GIT92148.1 membrane protein [Jannaschia sp. AI_61]
MTPTAPISGLPDPEYQPEFYGGVLTKRAVAWAIDVALITGFTFLVGLLTLSIGWFLWPITFVLTGFLYRTATLSNRSATWGMRLMGIELRDIRGDRFDGMTATFHVLGYYASMAFLLPALASIASMLITDRRQSLTDLLLGTGAINRPS